MGTGLGLGIIGLEFRQLVEVVVLLPVRVVAGGLKNPFRAGKGVVRDLELKGNASAVDDLTDENREGG